MEIRRRDVFELPGEQRGGALQLVAQHQLVADGHLGEDHHLHPRVLEHRGEGRRLLLLLLDLRGLHLDRAAIGLAGECFDDLQGLERTVVAQRLLRLGLDGPLLVDTGDRFDVQLETAVGLDGVGLDDLLEGNGVVGTIVPGLGWGDAGQGKGEHPGQGC